jgi:hypothetical protein
VGKWRTGKPDKPGWYNATLSPPSGILRWWNGKVWSVSCFSDESKFRAVRSASIKENARWVIYWRPLRKELRR